MPFKHFSKVFDLQDDSSGCSDSDDEPEIVDSDEDLYGDDLHGRSPHNSEEEPEELPIVAQRVSDIRAKHQSQLKSRDAAGRSRGGDRTDDAVLQGRYLYNEKHIRDSIDYECACEHPCCGWFDEEEVS